MMVFLKGMFEVDAVHINLLFSKVKSFYLVTRGGAAPEWIDSSDSEESIPVRCGSNGRNSLTMRCYENERRKPVLVCLNNCDFDRCVQFRPILRVNGFWSGRFIFCCWLLSVKLFWKVPILKSCDTELVHIFLRYWTNTMVPKCTFHCDLVVVFLKVLTVLVDVCEWDGDGRGRSLQKTFNPTESCTNYLSVC